MLDMVGTFYSQLNADNVSFKMYIDLRELPENWLTELPAMIEFFHNRRDISDRLLIDTNLFLGPLARSVLETAFIMYKPAKPLFMNETLSLSDTAKIFS